jgi:hypothetical protein
MQLKTGWNAEMQPESHSWKIPGVRTQHGGSMVAENGSYERNLRRSETWLIRVRGTHVG